MSKIFKNKTIRKSHISKTYKEQGFFRLLYTKQRNDCTNQDRHKYVESEPKRTYRIRLPPNKNIIDGIIKFFKSYFSLKKSYKNNIPKAVAPNNAITEVFAHKTSKIE